MRNLTATFLVLMIVSIPSVRADQGRVVYLYSAELAKSGADGAYAPTSGHVDLVEADLSSGRRSVLIKSFFNGALEDFSGSSIAVSHDGRHVAIGQNPTITATDGGSPDGPSITVTPNALRLWDRRTGRVEGIYPKYNSEELMWSSSGRYLAIPSEATIRIYDALTRRMRTYSGHAGFTCAAWSAKRDELIVVVPAKKTSTVYAQPVIGRQRLLFRWHDSIDEIAEFGDGSGYALCDSIGVVSCERSGRTKRLPIYRSHNDPWGVTFQPQPDGPWMAALTSYASGEPHINDDRALYVFRSGGSAFGRMAKWRTSYLSIQPSGGSITLMEPAGWLRGESTVVLRGEVIWGGEAGVYSRSDRWVFWTFHVPSVRAGSKAFDTEPGCLSAVWRPGK